MDEQELAKEIVAKHSAFPSQMNITSLLPHWPDQIMLDGVLFVQEAALRTAQSRVAQLEAAVGLAIAYHTWTVKDFEEKYGEVPDTEDLALNLELALKQADAKGE